MSKQIIEDFKQKPVLIVLGILVLFIALAWVLG